MLEVFLKDYLKCISNHLQKDGLWEKYIKFKLNIEKEKNKVNENSNGKNHLDFFDDYKISKNAVIKGFKEFIETLDFEKNVIIERINLDENTKKYSRDFEISAQDIINKYKNDYDELNSLCRDYENLIFENNIKFIEKDFEKKSIEIEDANSKLDIAINNLTNAESKSIKAKEELKDEEHRILTHVLTLLGVFTALITIILSTVSATTSWLNKSDSADFSYAILVPATIIIISMVAMFALLYLMIFKKYSNENKQETKENGDKGSEKKRFFFRFKKIDFKAFWSVIFLMIICIVLLGITIKNLCLDNSNRKYDNHRICAITDYNIDYKENKIYYIFNDLELSMDYNFDLIHEDGLHYCAEHKVFE